MANNETSQIDKLAPASDDLLHNLRELIQNARQKVLRAVDAVQVQTCWEIGRHIVEFEQRGAARAEYGAGLLQVLAASLSREFGKGFDTTNLSHMRVFYQAFPIRDALRPELSWTHYRTLLKVDQDSAKTWYMTEAATQGGRRELSKGRLALSITSGSSRLPTVPPSRKRPLLPSRRCRLPETSSAIR